jgi:AraC-like DNA-binding protein
MHARSADGPRRGPALTARSPATTPEPSRPRVWGDCALQRSPREPDRSEPLALDGVGDPFADILRLTEASSVVSGGFSARGDWALRFPSLGKLKLAAVVRGTCLLRLDGQKRAVRLEERRGVRPARAIASALLAQLLFVQALRAHLGGAGRLPSGWIRALRDERIAPAFRLTHGDPGRAWTLGELAKASALSRTSFATHFGSAAGVSPLSYLTEWRMRLARRARVEAAHGLERDAHVLLAIERLVDEAHPAFADLPDDGEAPARAAHGPERRARLGGARKRSGNRPARWTDSWKLFTRRRCHSRRSRHRSSPRRSCRGYRNPCSSCLRCRCQRSIERPTCTRGRRSRGCPGSSSMCWPGIGHSRQRSIESPTCTRCRGPGRRCSCIGPGRSSRRSTAKPSPPCSSRRRPSRRCSCTGRDCNNRRSTARPSRRCTTSRPRSSSRRRRRCSCRRNTGRPPCTRRRRSCSCPRSGRCCTRWSSNRAPSRKPGCLPGTRGRTPRSRTRAPGNSRPGTADPRCRRARTPGWRRCRCSSR